jgi:hypothetical protein
MNQAAALSDRLPITQLSVASLSNRGILSVFYEITHP